MAKVKSVDGLESIETIAEPAPVVLDEAPTPVAPVTPKHPLNVMADLFRNEANGAIGPVAASLLRLADSFDKYAKGL